MTKDETARLVAAARELWPAAWDINDTTFHVWHAVLGDVDYRTALDALLVMSVTGTFYPRPGPGDVWRAVHAGSHDEEAAWETARGYLSRSFPDLGIYPPDRDDRSLPARAYRLAGGYSVVNDARHGRRAFTKAWQDVTTAAEEETAAALPTRINQRQVES